MTLHRTGTAPSARRVRRLTAFAVALVAPLVLSACGMSGGAAAMQSTKDVLTIGMTASEIPSLDTTLSGEQGYEGYRFVGNQLYDGLTRYDLDQSTSRPKVVAGLATSWTLDPGKTSWTFHLRSGVTFADGTPFNADSVIFNLKRYTDKSFAYYDASAAGQASLSLGGVKSYEKLDDDTVRIVTTGVYSHLPEDLVFIYMASPTQVKKVGNAGLEQHPVGTGPFTFVSEEQGQQLVLARNDNYWRGVPKLRYLVLKPMPDVSTRIAALRSGQVNWIEAPDPDDILPLKKEGYSVDENSYDHIWTWILNTKSGPLANTRVRQAMNYAINRSVMSNNLLDGSATPAEQLAPVANAGYQKANNLYSYDPKKAKRLLATAGYANGFSITLSYPTSGSGNMQPGPMNQELQSDLAKVGITVHLKPIEWAAMLTSYVGGKFPDGADAMNISLTFTQETSWVTSFESASALNIGHYSNPKVNALLTEAQEETDVDKRADIYAQISQLITADAPWLFVVNDRNPRAMTSNVHGFVQPRSWFVDLTKVYVS